MTERVGDWVRWIGPNNRPSKWHHVIAAFQVGDETTRPITACGAEVYAIEREVWNTETQPIDEHGVCHHCLRAQEIAHRVAEAREAVEGYGPV